MHQASRRSSILTLVRFGFGRTPERLFVRLDSDRPLADLLADGYTFSLKFLEPAGVRFEVRTAHGQVVGTFWDRAQTGDRWIERATRGAAVAAGTILEAALPLAELASSAGARVAFFIEVSAPNQTEGETHPEHHPLEATVPDEQFEARHWTA